MIGVNIIDELRRADPAWVVPVAEPERLLRLRAANEIVRLRERHAEIVGELFGRNLEVAGWHQNGALEPLDNFFNGNGWLNEPAQPEEPAGD